MNRSLLQRLLPFLRWLPYSRQTLRADFIAGLTVALVLVPQAMAYAQLAGMPAYYGLYAAFLPVMVAAAWGSSNQLATGPVALVSLLTASSLAAFAAPGSQAFIALAIVLALLVGLLQLGFGLFRLGALVNFVSHPVIVGFTNAAALIIGLSQLNKLLGVPMDRSENFIRDIWGVIQQFGDTHVATLALGASAIVLIAALRKFAPRLPGVLIAVVLTTTLSWWIGFEKNAGAGFDAVADPEVRAHLGQYALAEQRKQGLDRELGAATTNLATARQQHGRLSQQAAARNYEHELLRIQRAELERENRERFRLLRRYVFERISSADGATSRLVLAGNVPPGAQAQAIHWRIQGLSHDRLALAGGGQVVGSIPAGLPSLSVPQISWDTLVSMLATASVIAMVGFMEAIAVAKAMAVRTRQRIDPNQELIGQGLANVVGAFSQSFPVSGSFSRSAVNINAGALTGMSSVFTGLLVLLTLLLLTPLLYHLPQAVLAAVIIMAVVNLLNFRYFKHAWQASRHDGIAAAVTFAATLALAPHLDQGVLVGAGLAIVLYLLRTMKPRVALLCRQADGTLREAAADELPSSEAVITLRFDGRLYFANVAYFEDAVLDSITRYPNAKYLLVVGDGINELDASGEEIVRQLNERLRAGGVTMVFSGLKKQVLDVMRATGLDAVIGQGNLFATADQALQAIGQPL